MAQHRGFTRKKFVEAVGHEHMRGYLSPRVEMNGGNVALTDEAVDAILQAQDEIVRKTVDEDFHCINDVADKGMDYLDRACQEFEQPFDHEWPRERVAMHLFLENPNAFQAAYDWYLYRTSANSMTHYQFVDVSASFDEDRVEAFRAAVEAFYSDQAKGQMCQVRDYKDGDEHFLMVARGDYLHTQPVWKNGAIETSVYRPAKEDVLRFSEVNSILSLKLSSRSNDQRRHYVETFGKCILGLSEVPDEVCESTTVSLEPIRTGNFSFWGNDQIEWVCLINAELEFKDIGATVIVRSGNVMETVHNHLKDLKLGKAQLKYAKLIFKLNYKGAPSRAIPVEIRPPQRSVISKRIYAQIIEAYLREYKVLLV